MKIMLDTNEYDKLLEHPESFDKLLRLLAEGRIELLSTHIQRDEILATPDAVKKARLEALLTHARMIETRGIVLDVSRVGEARVGSNDDRRIIDHVRAIKDGLIAATTSSDADMLVTDDKRFARRLMRYPGNKCEIINFQELEKRLANWLSTTENG
jgi:predicted nucleic acid-binding protein